MKNDRRLSFVALGVLVVAVCVVGFFYIKNQKIDASSISSTVSTGAIPLKAGWNDFTNTGYTLTFNSRIVRINGSLLTAREAIRRGIIEKIVVSGDNKTMQDGDEIGPGGKFSVVALNIENTPEIYLEGNGAF